MLMISINFASAEIHQFKATKGYHTYAKREPVLSIKPGDILETSTLYSDFFTEKDGPWPGEVGPIYIEGATPEDTLVIKILKLRPNIATGRSGTSTVYGSLTSTMTTPMLHDPVPSKMFIWKINTKEKTATLDLPNSRIKKIQVELHPMLGRLATAPPGNQSIPGRCAL